MTHCSGGWIIFLNYAHISDCLTTLVIVFNVQMNRRLKMWQKNGKNLKQRLAGCAFKKVGKFNYIIFSEFLYSVTAFIRAIPQRMILIFGFSLPGLYFFDIFETWSTTGQWLFFFFPLKSLVKLCFIASLVTSGIHDRNQHFMYVRAMFKLVEVLWWLCTWFYVLQPPWDSDRFNHYEFLLRPWFSSSPPL